MGPPTVRPARVALGFVIVSLVLLVVVPLWVGGRTQAIRQELRAIVEPAHAEADRMITQFDRQVASVRGYLLAGDAYYQGRYEAARAARLEAQRRLQPFTDHLGPPVPTLLDEVLEAISRWETSRQRLFLPDEGEEVPVETEIGDDLYDAVISAGERLEAQLLRAIADRREVIQQEERRALVVSPILALLALAAALVVAALWHRLREYGRETELLYREGQELALELGRTVDALEQRTVEAEAANRVKSEFLSAMSHELRTPLNAILGFTDLMAMGIPEPLPKKARSQVTRIDESARHLLGVIEQILSFSRMDAEPEKPVDELLDLPEVIRSTVEMMEPLARKKGLRLQTDLDRAPVPIRGDRQMVRQILINLLGNAIKFTENGSVEVGAWEENGEVVLRVRDTGVGISPEHLSRVFEPYWQVDQTLTRSAGGTGLGLTVSRSLAQLLGGDITAESSPGKGSTFTLRLPARRESLSPETPESRQSMLPDVRKADDEWRWTIE